MQKKKTKQNKRLIHCVRRMGERERRKKKYQPKFATLLAMDANIAQRKRQHVRVYTDSQQSVCINQTESVENHRTKRKKTATIIPLPPPPQPCYFEN